MTLANWKVRIAKDSSNNTYIGTAARNANVANAVWRIVRVDVDCNVDWCQADDGFEYIWNDRESYSYS